MFKGQGYLREKQTLGGGAARGISKKEGEKFLCKKEPPRVEKKEGGRSKKKGKKEQKRS